jgi:ArsR family transcriptional regulator, cadmium/lead-responsive transcriptional repressor
MVQGTGMLTTTHAQSLALKAKLFRGFSDPSRLSILEALRDDARSVGELVEMTGLSQSNVSNHLACLLDCGLVAREPQGRRVIYRLADERVGTLLSLADDILEEVAQGVYVCPRYEAPANSAPVPISRTRSTST